MSATAQGLAPSPITGLERLLNLEEAAVVLRRSHWTLRRDIKAGTVRCLRIGKRVFIQESELQRILAGSTRSL